MSRISSIYGNLTKRKQSHFRVPEGGKKGEGKIEEKKAVCYGLYVSVTNPAAAVYF